MHKISFYVLTKFRMEKDLVDKNIHSNVAIMQYHSVIIWLNSYVPCLYDIVVTYNSTLKWKSNILLIVDFKMKMIALCYLLEFLNAKEFYCTMLVQKQITHKFL